MMTSDDKINSTEVIETLFESYYSEVMDPKIVALSASHSLSGIWDVDTITENATWSNHLKDMTGLLPETIPNFGTLYEIMHPEDRAGTQEILGRYLKTDERFEFEFRIIRPIDQNIIWVHSTGRTFLNKKGEAIRMVGSMTDITYLKEAEEAAKHSDKAKSEFLANMSHEIRTPMNGIMGMTELLKNSDLSAREKEFVNVIERSGDALLTIINDILDFSKIEAGHMELDDEPFQLREAIEDVMALLASKVSESGVDLLLRIQPGLPSTFKGDVGRIRQILTNIVGNAVKFTLHGHIFIDVSGGVSGNMCNLNIKIEDTGIGIPEEKIDHIFEQFTQVDGSTTRKFGGTGLGLSISKNLIELMGGSITLSSTVGEGSIFTLSVSLPTHADIAPPRIEEFDIRNKKVLIIDDNPINRDILKEQLTQWKCQSVAASSANVGIAVLKKANEKNIPIDLIILDYQMPELNGEDFIRHLQTITTFNKIPVIVLSSIDDNALRIRMRNYNISSFLTKPARASLLYNAIGNAVYTSKTDDVKTPINNILPSVPPSPMQTRAKVNKNTHVDVLIAEDNDVNQMYAKFVMEELGLSYKIVPNGKIAIDKWELLSPKIILMDISMPEMNGYDATKAIRELETQKNLPHTPIIAVTAHALKSDKDLCLKRGMDGYLSKPMSIEHLKSCLLEWNVIPEDKALSRKKA